MSYIVLPRRKGKWEGMDRELSEGWGKGAVGDGGLATEKEILGQREQESLVGICISFCSAVCNAPPSSIFP